MAQGFLPNFHKPPGALFKSVPLEAIGCSIKPALFVDRTWMSYRTHEISLKLKVRHPNHLVISTVNHLPEPAQNYYSHQRIAVPSDSTFWDSKRGQWPPWLGRQWFQMYMHGLFRLTNFTANGPLKLLNLTVDAFNPKTPSDMPTMQAPKLMVTAHIGLNRVPVHQGIVPNAPRFNNSNSSV